MSIDLRVFEWPDREQAKRRWELSTEGQGEGIFFITVPRDNSAKWTIGTPQWASKQALRQSPMLPELYQAINQEITQAHEQGGYALLGILNNTKFQLIKVPFDQAQECDLIFEVEGREKK